MVYYSGKIEGNTYTYVETEALLKDGITSEKQYENAKMLKNLHNLFVSEMEYIHKGKNTEIIDERTLLRLDSGLSSGLVSDEEAGQFRTRPVRISGIDYVPPRDVYEIRFKLSEVLYRQTELENPLERSVSSLQYCTNTALQQTYGTPCGKYRHDECRTHTGLLIEGCRYFELPQRANQFL